MMAAWAFYCVAGVKKNKKIKCCDTCLCAHQESHCKAGEIKGSLKTLSSLINVCFEVDEVWCTATVFHTPFVSSLFFLLYHLLQKVFECRPNM